MLYIINMACDSAEDTHITTITITKFMITNNISIVIIIMFTIIMIATAITITITTISTITRTVFVARVGGRPLMTTSTIYSVDDLQCRKSKTLSLPNFRPEDRFEDCTSVG